MKKKIALMLCVVLVASLSGCASDTKQSTEEKQDVTITYSLWGDYECETYTQEVLDAFEEKYPYIHVDLEIEGLTQYNKDFEENYQNGNLADVNQIHYEWLDDYSEDGNGFYDLLSLADQINLDDLDENALTYGKILGKLNAIPVSVETTVFVYNRTLYEDYGLSIPVTWDNLFEDAALMSGDGIYQLAVTRKQLLCMLFAYVEQTTGKTAFDGDGNLNFGEAEFSTMLQFYDRLIEEKIVCPVTGSSEALMRMGKIAGAVSTISDVDSYGRYIEKAGGTPSIGLLMQSTNASKLGYFAEPNAMYAIKSDCQYPEEAGLLINFLLNSRDSALAQLLDKGIPSSDRAMTYLLEADKMDELTYRAKLNSEYYCDDMEKEPYRIEDSLAQGTAVVILEDYQNGKESLEESIQRFIKIYTD